MLPQHVVDRPPLRGRLDAVFDRRVATIVAQAGSGKSVLLAQWRASHPDVKFVWVDVVAADDDPGHFANQLFAALARLDAGFADLAPLVAIGDGGLGEPLLEALATHLADVGPAVLIFDDMHHLSNSRLLTDLGRLAVLAPSTVHIVMASRSDLRFGSRLQLRGDVVELRQADLVVNFADSSELLKRVTGRTIATKSVRALVGQTEGWMAGLVLAGVTLRSRDDVESFVADFSGSDRLVADYLADEVLAGMTLLRRQALLRLALLDEMSAELVDFLFSDADSQQMFGELESSSIFVVPVDDRREWFRFHHLFGEMLRHQLRAEQPTSERPLLVRAADWHLQRGETRRAVGYFLRSGEWTRVLEAIAVRGSTIFERGEMATVANWIEQVPDTVLAERSDIVTMLGILKGLDGRGAEADDILNRVIDDTATELGLLACAEAFSASLAQWRPDLDRSVRHAERALELLAELGDRPTPNIINLSGPRSLETVALFSGGRAHFLRGDFVSARDFFERALASDGAAYSLWRIISLGGLALLEAWAGDSRRAERLATEALVLATEVGSLAHPSIGEAYLAMTLVLLERGETGRAALSLHEATARANSNGRVQLVWVAYVVGLRLREREGRPFDSAPPVSKAPRVVIDRLSAELESSCASAERGTAGAGAIPLYRAQPLADPLTDRELEILSYLPTHLTAGELAQQCFIALSTVKTHMAHIYLKLGVTTRSAAVRRARELELLPA